jgi:hypothetical protein
MTPLLEIVTVMLKGGVFIRREKVVNQEESLVMVRLGLF